MELTEEQLREIWDSVLEGAVLSELLVTQFPHANISIIRGYDNFSDEAYTQGAFFDEEEAVDSMRKIHLNGTGDLSDSYHVLRCTVLFLEEGRIYDGRTLQSLSDISRIMIYSSLKDKLSGQS